MGKPYFGYKWHGGKDKTVKTKWIVDKGEAEVVVATFNEYLKDGATLKSTALAITAMSEDYSAIFELWDKSAEEDII